MTEQQQKTGRKLWLDDYRKEPVGWERAKTYDECVNKMSSCLYDEVSLDHDLADTHYQTLLDESTYETEVLKVEERTGYHVALWMAENGYMPDTVWVHSMNPSGAEAMVKLLRNHHPKGAGAVNRRHAHTY